MRGARDESELSLADHTRTALAPQTRSNGYLDLALEAWRRTKRAAARIFETRARCSEHLYALIEDLLLASRADAASCA